MQEVPRNAEGVLSVSAPLIGKVQHGLKPQTIVDIAVEADEDVATMCANSSLPHVLPRDPPSEIGSFAVVCGLTNRSGGNIGTWMPKTGDGMGAIALAMTGLAAIAGVAIAALRRREKR